MGPQLAQDGHVALAGEPGRHRAVRAHLEVRERAGDAALRPIGVRAPDPALDPAAYLRSIYAVRDRSRLVLDKAKKNQLKHFTVDMSKFTDVASFVVSIVKVRT